MDAVKFIKERNRMCTTYTSKSCEGCPADNYGGEDVACIMVDKIDAERLVPIVESWSAAHPRRTRQSVFLEQYPNAESDHRGILIIDPCDVDKTMHGKDGDCYNGSCDDCRAKFWGQEVE